MFDTETFKKYRYVFIVLIIITIYFTMCNDCGCSDLEIDSYRSSMGLSYEEAKELCCKMKKM